MERYLNRLVEEWRQHGKIVIAVDFDDTIFPWKLYKSTEGMMKKTVELLKMAHTTGAYIVVFSACDPSRHDEIHQYCQSIGLWVDAINKNPIPLPYGHHGKVYANIYIDDRAGIMEALNTLEQAMMIIRADKNSTDVIQQTF